MTAADDRCACGRPLHYEDPATERRMCALVAALGPDIKVALGRRAWLVPRHYIALHGIKANELPGSRFPECEPDPQVPA